MLPKFQRLRYEMQITLAWIEHLIVCIVCDTEREIQRTRPLDRLTYFHVCYHSLRVFWALSPWFIVCRLFSAFQNHKHLLEFEICMYECVCVCVRAYWMILCTIKYSLTLTQCASRGRAPFLKMHNYSIIFSNFVQNSKGFTHKLAHQPKPSSVQPDHYVDKKSFGHFSAFGMVALNSVSVSMDDTATE